MSRGPASTSGMVARMKTMLCVLSLMFAFTTAGAESTIVEPTTCSADEADDGPTVETGYMCRICYKGECRYVHCKE
jgi:hypothetical protein